MTQDDALGQAGAARGVLQKGGVGAAKGRQVERNVRAGGCGQFCRSHNFPQAFHLAMHQSGKTLRLGHGDHQPGETVGSNCNMPLQVFLYLLEATRGVKRHRHAAGQQHPEKTVKVIRIGGEHDEHGFSRGKPVVLQTNGDPFCALPELAVDDDLSLVLIAVEPDMGPVRMHCHMVFQYVDQCFSRMRHGLHRGRLNDFHLALGDSFRPAVRAEHGP
jgi:hypothetical protein